MERRRLHFQVHPLPSQGGASRKPRTHSLLSGTRLVPYGREWARSATVRIRAMMMMLTETRMKAKKDMA